MSGKVTRNMARTLLATALVGSVVLCAPRAQAKAGGEPPSSSAQNVRRPAALRSASKRSPSPNRDAFRGLFYQRNWGVDIVGVHPVSSGYMLRFDYRVVDPVRASALNDRKVKPYLIDEATRTALAVPAMENIGELRQVAPPELNRTYFIIFGNPGRLVKPGRRVTIVIGNLRAEGLVVR